MNKVICPYCLEELSHLDFEHSITSYGREGGRCGVDGDDCDYDDNGAEYGESNIDSTRYTCPECGEEIEDISTMVQVNDETEPKTPEINEDGKEIKEIEEEKPAIELEPALYNVTEVESLVCANCGNKNNPIERGENIIFCIKCGNELNREHTKVLTFGKK